MDNKAITAIDFTATLRPKKLAFLINSNCELINILDEIIPWISTVWGGANCFFLPVSSNCSNISEINTWIKLLQKYDPDQVISTGRFSEELLEAISSYLLTKAEIFQYDLQANNDSILICEREEFTIAFEDLFSNVHNPITLLDIEPTGSIIHDLWFFSFFGRLGKYFEPLKKLPFIKTSSKNSIDVNYVETHCEEISKKRNKELVKYSPLLNTMNFLGCNGVTGPIYDFFFPNVIIVGDTLEDWCLFQSMYYFSPSVFWIPQSLLSFGDNLKKNVGFNNFLYSLLSDISNKSRYPVAISSSLSRNQIENVINQSLRTIFFDKEMPKYQVETNFNSLVKNWMEWGQPNNYKDINFIFQNNISLQKAPTLAPKGFTMEPYKAKYLVDLIPNGYKYFGHPKADVMPLSWYHPGATTKSDSKRNYKGDISFNPVCSFTYSNMDLDSALHSPKVLKREFFDDLKTVLSKKEYKLKRSTGTRNIQAILKLWNNSLDEFFDDYFESESSKIFEVFKTSFTLNGRKRNKEKFGLHDEAGIVIHNKFLFKFPIGSAFRPEPISFTNEKFDRFLENEIIIRGEVLHCLACGYKDFYPESIANRKFECKRCYETQIKKSESMKSPEPRFVYNQNPLLFGLQESNKDLVLFGAKKIKDSKQEYFEFECEVEIVNAEDKEGKIVQEIDIIGNLDGRLIVGECKINGKLKGEQLKKYVNFCKDFNVDKFFCISNKKWNDNTKGNILNEFKKQKNTEVRFIP